jgi:hypothetical protein
MKYPLLTAVSCILYLALFVTTCTSPPLPKQDSNELFEKPMANPWTDSNEDTDRVHEEKNTEPEIVAEESAKNQAISKYKDRMILDITAVWEMFLDDANIGPNDSRWQMIPIHAKELADAIITYQNEPTDIGGRLPKHRTTHILMAVMVTKESSLRHKAKGGLGEVGLMQIHGRALAGYNPNVVRHNSRLGVTLGVRWFAAQMDKCKGYEKPRENWRTNDWIQPLSLYAGGPNAISKKTGHCKRFRIAKERINLTKLYLTRIKTQQ